MPRIVIVIHNIPSSCRSYLYLQFVSVLVTSEVTLATGSAARTAGTYWYIVLASVLEHSAFVYGRSRLQTSARGIDILTGVGIGEGIFLGFRLSTAALDK
jgi:hypothetical protein